MPKKVHLFAKKVTLVDLRHARGLAPPPDGPIQEHVSLQELRGIALRVILYRGRNDELRRDSPWQLDFLQARPDQLTVYLNLNAAGLELEKVKLPEWAGR